MNKEPEPARCRFCKCSPCDDRVHERMWNQLWRVFERGVSCPGCIEQIDFVEAWDEFLSGNMDGFIDQGLADLDFSDPGDRFVWKFQHHCGVWFELDKFNGRTTEIEDNRDQPGGK